MLLLLMLWLLLLLLLSGICTPRDFVATCLTDILNAGSKKPQCCQPTASAKFNLQIDGSMLACCNLLEKHSHRTRCQENIVNKLVCQHEVPKTKSINNACYRNIAIAVVIERRQFTQL
jgi:hypothetical protein